MPKNFNNFNSGNYSTADAEAENQRLQEKYQQELERLQQEREDIRRYNEYQDNVAESNLNNRGYGKYAKLAEQINKLKAELPNTKNQDEYNKLVETINGRERFLAKAMHSEFNEKGIAKEAFDVMASSTLDTNDHTLQFRIGETTEYKTTEYDGSSNFIDAFQNEVDNAKIKQEAEQVKEEVEVTTGPEPEKEVATEEANGDLLPMVIENQNNLPVKIEAKEVLKQNESFWRKVGKKAGRLWEKHKKTIAKAGMIIGAAAAMVVGTDKMANNHSHAEADGEPRQETVTKAESSHGFTEVEKRIDTKHNGKYDKENDDFYKFDQKESRGSVGTDLTELKGQAYIDRFMAEDNVAGTMQVLEMNPDMAQKVFGMSAEEATDRIEKGDQGLFNKLQDFKKNLWGKAQVSEQKNIDKSFNSIYRVQEEDGSWSFRKSLNLNIGGTYRTINYDMVINGEHLVGNFDMRDQCSQYMVEDGDMILRVVTPHQYDTYVTPTPPSETPKENPKENPKETPKENPKETPKTEYHKDWTLDKNQYDNIDQMGKGELTKNTTEEEKKNNVDPTIKSGEASSEVKAEGNDKSIDVSNLEKQPQEDAGEVTEAGKAQEAKNQANAEAEKKVTAEYEASSQDQNVNIGGGKSISIDEIRRAQQEANNQSNSTTLSDGTIIDFPQSK
jgi:ZYRO0B15180p